MARGCRCGVLHILFVSLVAELSTNCMALQHLLGGNSTDDDAARDRVLVSAKRGSFAALAGAHHEDLDVPYGKNQKHKVDLYWPAHLRKPKAGWPTVIIMHGKGQDKVGFKGWCKNFIVRSGRLCVSGNYRIEDKYRDDDIYDMFSWFWKNSQKWNVDKKNIVFSGFSQGSLTINNIIWDKKTGKELLDTSKGHKKPKVKAVMMLSGVSQSHPRQVKKASYFPTSTFIMSSDTDKAVPYRYSKDLAKQLDNLKQNVHFKNIPDAGHNIMYSNKRNEWYAAILEWLDTIIPAATVDINSDGGSSGGGGGGGGRGGDKDKIKVTTAKNVPYGSGCTGRKPETRCKEQVVDISWPTEDKIRPKKGWSAFIMLDGGSTTKDSLKQYCDHVLPYGRMCVCGSYRISDDHRDDDVYDLIKWFTDKKALDKYKVNKEAVVVGGFSLGGLTLNNVIWDQKDGKDLLKSPPKLEGVMFLVGVWESHFRKAKKAQYFPKSTFILSSDAEEEDPYEYSKKLYDELKKLKQKATFVNIPGAHLQYAEEPARSEMFDAMEKFLDDTIPRGNIKQK